MKNVFCAKDQWVIQHRLGNAMELKNLVMIFVIEFGVLDGKQVLMTGLSRCQKSEGRERLAVDGKTSAKDFLASPRKP